MAQDYQARRELRPKTLEGISEDQIAQHWSLYEGYVNNVNKLNDRISELTQAGDFGVEFSELKRRLGFEYDGMILHEHYFGVLKAGQPPLPKASPLRAKLAECFGSFEDWQKEFAAVGKMRGIGWAILYQDPKSGHLSNHWIATHEEGHPAGFIPLLVMDVWEHAYMVDLGASGRAVYIETFLKNVDWAQVDERSRQASAAESLGAHSR